jgi:hypothetical protein
MKILSLKNEGEGYLKIEAMVSQLEFSQWAGEINAICSFSPDIISEPAKVNKTGARHSSASWLLFPVALRKRFKTNKYDFDAITCGAVDFQDHLFVVYKMPKKFMGFFEVKK